MTYLNAKKYIQASPDTQNSSPIDFHELLTKLSSPQKRLKYIRLAGSRGKTSSLEMLRSVICEAGYNVGCLRQPLLDEPRLNICIGSSYLGMQEFADYTARVREACSEMNITLTKVEILICISLMAFKDSARDICIIESDHADINISKALPLPISVVICGMLSQSDTKDISDLRSYIRRGITEVVSATQTNDAFKIITDDCYSAGCRMTLPSRRALQISKQSFLSTEFTYKEKPYKIRLCGAFQARNAALCLEVTDMLGRCGYKISPDAARDGLYSAKVPSRFESLSISPLIIANACSTPSEFENTLATLSEFGELEGKTFRLCLPNSDISESALSSLESISIEKVYTVSQEASVSSDIVACKNARKLASALLDGLTSDTPLLILGDINFVENVRYNILAKMGF